MTIPAALLALAPWWPNPRLTGLTLTEDAADLVRTLTTPARSGRPPDCSSPCTRAATPW